MINCTIQKCAILLQCDLTRATKGFLSSNLIFFFVNVVFFLIYYLKNKGIGTLDFLGFSLYIANTTNTEDKVLCFRDTNYTRATIPNPVNITCPYHGRYVIYYNNRNHRPAGYSTYAFNELCELEVYGIDY